MIRLNPEYSALYADYQRRHTDPRNQLCHLVGTPMIAASIPLAATVVGLPLAAVLFVTGWGFQFTGHYFEKKAPAFLSDHRQHLMGALWWLNKVGVRVEVADGAS
jgi:uncharacterized membrane protein YGL010W